jgi:hypothetical protein
MLNFWNAFFGLLMSVFGLLVFIYILKKSLEGEKDRFGNHFEIYSGAILLIMVGLTLLIKELMKL